MAGSQDMAQPSSPSSSRKRSSDDAAAHPSDRTHRFREPVGVRRAKRDLALGLTLTLLGIASSVATGDPWIPYLTLGGTLLALLGLHRLGRAGRDA